MISMISKCANPTCPASFRSLRDGRVFVGDGEVDHGSLEEQRPQRLRYLWLCSSCCRTMTVTVEDGEVKIVNLVATGAAA
jgi:hypothetical protein